MCRGGKMKDEKLLKKVEKQELTVSEYLDYKQGIPIKINQFVSKKRFKKSRGCKLVIIKGSLIIVPPRIPISLLKWLSKFLYRYKNINGKINIEQINFNDLVKSLKDINRHTMLIDVESKTEQFMFQIWSV